MRELWNTISSKKMKRFPGLYQILRKVKILISFFGWNLIRNVCVGTVNIICKDKRYKRDSQYFGKLSN